MSFTQFHPAAAAPGSRTAHEDPPPSVTAQLLSFTELSTPAPADAPQVVPNLASGARQPSNPLHHVKTTLTVRVGSAELTVGELLNATQHQVIRLDRLVEGAVDVLLEGQIIARGTLVAVDEHFGVRITELPRLLST